MRKSSYSSGTDAGGMLHGKLCVIRRFFATLISRQCGVVWDGASMTVLIPPSLCVLFLAPTALSVLSNLHLSVVIDTSSSSSTFLSLTSFLLFMERFTWGTQRCHSEWGCQSGKRVACDALLGSLVTLLKPSPTMAQVTKRTETHAFCNVSGTSDCQTRPSPTPAPMCSPKGPKPRP